MYKENLKHIKQAQNGNEKAMELLLKNNAGLIWNVVKRFTGRGYEIEDLHQIACMGFIKAIKRFDITLEVQLSTYAVPYIMGEIRRFLRDDGLIKVSRQTKELAMKINQLQSEYRMQKGEELSIIQIANLLQVSKEEVAAAIESTNFVESIDSTDGNEENNRLKIEKITDNKDEYSRLINHMTIQELIEKLDDREKQVVLLRYYKEQTQAQVGKILGITQVQVSRIEKRVLEKMRLKLEAV